MTTVQDVLDAIESPLLRHDVAVGWMQGRYTPMPASDPAQALVKSRHFTVPTVYRQSCYICRDPEFALLGMSLCRPCPACENGHIAADDVTCDDCGFDLQEAWEREQGDSDV